ncbi:MAG: Lipopolysaccharide export system permease protein LptF, partial [uncultured Sphingomonadaceae bacterium]
EQAIGNADRPLPRTADRRAAGRHANPRGHAAAAGQDAAPVRFRRVGGRARGGGLADARQPDPRISVAGHSDRAAARHAARVPQARADVGARQPARRRDELRAAAPRTVYVRGRAAAAQLPDRRLRPAARTLRVRGAALRASLGRARRVDQGRRVHQARQAHDAPDRGVGGRRPRPVGHLRFGRDRERPHRDGDRARGDLPGGGGCRHHHLPSAGRPPRPRRSGVPGAARAGLHPLRPADRLARRRRVPGPQRGAQHGADDSRTRAHRQGPGHDRFAARRDARQFPLPHGGGRDDAAHPAARCRARRAAQAQRVVARHLPVDRDDRHLPQGEPICGGHGRGGADRSGGRVVGAVRAVRRADPLHVSDAGACSRRSADRRAGTRRGERRRAVPPGGDVPPPRSGRASRPGRAARL